MTDYRDSFVNNEHVQQAAGNAVKDFASTPEGRQAMSSWTQAALRDEQARNAASNAAQTAWQDPNVRSSVLSAAGTAGAAAARGVQAVGVVIVDYVKDNHYSIKAFSFLGGLALIVIAIWDLVLGAITFIPSVIPNILEYSKSIYRLMFGVVICVVDGPAEKLPDTRAAVLRYFSFLGSNYSAAFFYLFIACFQWTTKGDTWLKVLYQIEAIYFLVLAVAHVVYQCFFSQPPPQQHSEGGHT
mmetsp:Transcript_3563/g.5747  ORF Transcript_3563/g.5747 Transcript_3563/m.5747 type:complete len:242 (+) Transcript_3563:74-799(+)